MIKKRMGRIDHGMVLRLLFATILLALVTGWIKSWALKKNADITTPKLAFRAGSMINKGMLPGKDGWGNPFFYYEDMRVLRSAGRDESFQTDDDLFFPVYLGSCTSEIRDWIVTELQLGGYRMDTLPQSYTFVSNKFAVVHENELCFLPDFSGPDRRAGTKDDWHFSKVVEQ
jgi:hypothetical protein